MINYFAGVLVQNHAGQFLALCFSAKNPSWKIPGGRVENGESARMAAVRELLEEAGIVVLPEDLHFRGNTLVAHNGVWWTGYIFTLPGPVFETNIHVTEPGISAWEFLTREEFISRNPWIEAELQLLK